MEGGFFAATIYDAIRLSKPYGDTRYKEGILYIAGNPPGIIGDFERHSLNILYTSGGQHCHDLFFRIRRSGIGSNKHFQRE